MLPLHHIKKTLLCMSVCLFIAACNGQYGQPTAPDIDVADVIIDVPDTDSISYITVIDIIE